MQTPVLLADDHVVFREGLRAMLEREQDLRIVAEASTGAEAVEFAERFNPEILIVDLGLPVLNGFEVIRRVREKQPHIRIIMLTAYCEESYVNRGLELGIHGFVSKENPFSVLIDAIRETVKDRKYLCPLVCKMRENQRERRPNAQSERGIEIGKHLTTRELQVLKLVAEGCANKQVAIALQISIKTVEKHRQQLMDKLGLHDTASLTRYAIAAGVIKSIIPRATELD